MVWNMDDPSYIDPEQCVMCQTLSDEKLTIVGKGIEAIISYSETFGRDNLLKHLLAVKVEREHGRSQSSTVNFFFLFNRYHEFGTMYEDKHTLLLSANFCAQQIMAASL